jgi:predicted HTH transcriptional regulator
VVGVDEIDFSEEKIQQIISSRIDPPIPVSLEILKYNGKNVAVINIYNSPQRPYQMRDNGAFYIRRGSTNDTMRKQEIISAFQENLTIDVELCPIPHSDLNCIDYGIVNNYFLSQGIEINEENKIELMENASIIYMDKDSGKYMVTLGGLLVFSKVNNICIPHNMIKIINKINKNFKSVFIIQGDLISMMNRSEKVVRKIINVKSYPVEAINKGVREAIVYRDYSDFSRGIEVVIGFNSIIITSPGILTNRKNTNFYNYLNRNMWIYEKIIALDTRERSMNIASGFNRMQKKFKNKGKVKFINSMKNYDFKIIYPGIKNFK